jgi:hypothetical protein
VKSPRGLYAANELAAFALELVILAVLSAWGVWIGHGLAASIAIGIAAPAVAAVVWALFAAPRARITLPLAGILVVKAAVFAAAVAALAGMGHPAWAAVLGLLLLVNTTAAVAFKARQSADQ